MAAGERPATGAPFPDRGDLTLTRGDDLAEVAPNLAPPPGNPRFPLFDSLRAIAALSVFLGHTVTLTYSLAQHRSVVLFAEQVAYQGVAIFFLISGFLLYRPFLTARRTGRPLGVRSFARRRVLRIVPGYWVALTVLVVAGLVSGVTADNWWIFYGFSQIYSFNTLGRGIGVAWTLCIEVTFYAALPIFAVVAARLSPGRLSIRGDVVLLVSLAIASLAFRAHFSSFADIATVSTLPGTFLWFALGMALAIASVIDEGGSERSWLAALVTVRPTLSWVVAAVASALLYYLFRDTNAVATQIVEHALYGLVALLILLPGVFGEMAGGMPRRLLRVSALAWIGLISYGFYLYHPVAIAQIDKLAAHQHLPAYPVVLALAGLITTACAAASYYIVERPLMRLGRQTDQRSRGGPGSDTARRISSLEITD
jgi:peptidoglycan/LPS O-acetylase OafA/YrhL